MLSIDDDFEVDVEAFRIGFETWKLNQYRFVGYYPRHAERSNGKYKYIGVDRAGDVSIAPNAKSCIAAARTTPNIVLSQQTYSMLLSGGGLFLNRAYMDRYTFTIPSEHRDLVDSLMNCEDLLLQFTVPPAQHPPILVAVSGALSSRVFTPEAYDKKTGISSRPGHGYKRELCLRTFGEALGWPLVATRKFQKFTPNRPFYCYT